MTMNGVILAVLLIFALLSLIKVFKGFSKFTVTERDSFRSPEMLLG